MDGAAAVPSNCDGCIAAPEHGDPACTDGRSARLDAARHADALRRIDRCVEFIRVSGTLLPDRVFLRIVPELKHGSRTPAGVPVRPQLMGSDPVCLAENAAKLAALEPAGIDLNFGCPARTVNRHRGGAVLLDEPELVGALVGAVRRAVPARVPISAKMRLGFNDDHRALDCARAIAGNGAAEIVVHARTKADGYRPPAYWERIAAIRAVVAIPVVANGEIWSVEDALRCRAVSGCTDLMLGRGMVSDPGLAMKIAAPAMPVLRHELRPR
jgi:tRNA-dihydrouridine synthase C